MRELATLGAALFGVVGILFGIICLIIVLVIDLKSEDRSLEGFVGAGVFLFLAGVISLVIMFSVGLTGAK